jgi:hypothetical protein
MGRPLKIAKAQVVLTVTDTATTGSVVTISGGNLTTTPTVGIISGMPFVVASTVGGLTAGTIYYVNAILSNTTFSVSATQLSVQPQVLATLTNTSGGSVRASFNVVDGYFNNPNGGVGYPATNANTYGVVGGNTAIYGSQVLTRVAIGIAGNGTISASTTSTIVTGVGTAFNTQLSAGSAIQTSDGVDLGFVNTITNATSLTMTANSASNVSGVAYSYADDEPGFIVRQKGKTKYLVTGTTTGLTGACYTANVANTALTPNTMNIVATYANSATAYVQSLSDIRSQVFYDTSNAVFAPDVYASFNSAATANAAAGITYPVVTIANL